MSEKILHVEPWAPHTHDIAQDFIGKIHAVAPELEVLFMGAAALGLPGKNDIDLDILCSKEDIVAYTQKLLPILGTPKDTNDHLAAWEFQYEGFEIDIILSDPSMSHVPEQQSVFEKLKTEPILLKEYSELKQACDGLPYTIYENRKKAFFKRLLNQ